MKATLTLLLALSAPLLAIPNAIFGGLAGTSSPLDGQDLTNPIIAAVKNGQQLPGEWQPEASVAGTRSAYLMARPKVFGQDALLVRGLWRGDELEEVQVTYNDAGSYFGYGGDEVPAGLQGQEKEDFLRARALDKQETFSTLHEESLQEAKEALQQKAERGRAKEIRFGKSRAIRAQVLEYHWEGLTARLFHGPDRLVRILVRKKGTFPDTWMDREVAEMDDRAFGHWLRERVTTAESGDLLLGKLEVVPQGYRPYCGLNTLVMVGRYLGLHLDEDWLASAGKFQNTGSAAGSQMLSLYGSVASEAGLKMKRLNDFDDNLVKRSLRDGLPVIVWRRWSRERNQEHTRIAREVAAGQAGEWGELDAATFPDEESPLHASVIVGFNEERGEFLFLESWAGQKGPRRMHSRELDATAYLTFCFQN